jgi:hypothetical protein
VLRRIFGPKWNEVRGEWRKLHNGEISSKIMGSKSKKQSHLYLEPLPFYTEHRALVFILIVFIVMATLCRLLNRERRYE